MDIFDMAQLILQDPLPSSYYYNVLQGVANTCPRIWDPTQARFETCALPYISAIPAVVALCIILSLSSQFVLRGRLTPKWTRTFVQEPEEEPEDPDAKQKYYISHLTRLLFVASLVGLGLQLATVFVPTFRLTMVYPAASWAVVCLLLVTYRPRTTPFYTLILIISIVASQVIVLVDGTSRLTLDGVPAILAALTGLVSIGVILLMPMRDPLQSKEGISPPFSPPTAELRSPEDNLTLWQFMTVSWMAPLISLGSARQLNDEDVWELAYEFKHRLLHDRFREVHGAVLSRLLQANGLDLVIIAIFGIIEVVANFSAPVLLQKILQSMENPFAPKQAALKYAILTLVVRLISSQSGVFGLWFGRRAYERSRGEMITMLYEKTLSRKVVSISSKGLIEADLDTSVNGNSNANGVSKQSVYPRLGKLYDWMMKPFHWLGGKKKKPKNNSKDLASMGKIMNLMRFDAYEVAQRFWDFAYLINHPLSVIFSVVLIWKLLGWPCLIGIITLVLAQGINALAARALLYWERERRAATDTKLHKISQLVDSIRHLRYYGWQDVWLERIMDSRQHELKLRIITAIWQIVISFTNIFASGMFPVVAFWAYTVLAGESLRIDVAFPALQLFTMLETSLREIPGLITVLLNTKVSLGRLDEFMNEPDKGDTDFIPNSKIEMNRASFAWPGATDPVLHDISLSFEAGLNVICGEVGAGKSALLQALLGELDQLNGEYHRTNEMVGYCGQTPWLQSMSIRDNILFSAPYEEARYKEVLEVCALVLDMSSFKHGDLSLVGENGVGLSGGQKARVALARAVYSKANILLLDDPLSALDHQTAEFIVRRCLSGPLLEGRTTILVTHRTELCLGLAKQAVQMTNGRAKLIDPDAIPFEELHGVKSSDTTNEETNILNEDEKLIVAPEKFMEDEYRAHGGVKAAVYWEYIKAGKLRWWFVLIIVLALYRIIDVGETWFLKQWGEAYGDPAEAASKGPFGDLPSPETNIRPWLVGFFLLALAQSLAYLLSQAVMLVIIYQAGKSLFQRVMVMVTHTTFRFYDITPVGRLMNRLTSDINTVDGNISNQFQQVVMLSIAWISSIVVIGSVTPVFLIFAIALTIGFVFIFIHFLPTSQSLRRLEMVSLTPLISNFGELTAGLTTIRAYCAASRFQDRVINVTDKFQKMDHFYWSLQAWLTYRFDALSACSTFILTALALYTDVSAGLTAFVLTAAGKFVISTHMLCRQYGQLQMDFVSVERVVELLHLDQEPPGKVHPPAYWPRYGSDIVFEDVTIKYAPHLDPALSNISLTIKGGSTTALIGRTGSGKSTLALSLLATNLPAKGRILVDGIDISTIDLQALRSRVTFLAQEPVLFPGSMRANLDPLDEYTDVECISVLHKIAANHQWTLDTHIDTGGRNLSQGQRQLVGLARALLRRSPIVVMDEATASIDAETAGRIQGILREEMSESTVVVIAHRVEAVRGAESCVILGKGRVLEVGEAGGMVDMMGEG